MVVGLFRSILCRFSKYGLLGGHNSRASFRIGASSQASLSDFRKVSTRVLVSDIGAFVFGASDVCGGGVLVTLERRFLLCWLVRWVPGDRDMPG